MAAGQAADAAVAGVVVVVVLSGVYRRVTKCPVVGYVCDCAQ